MQSKKSSINSELQVVTLVTGDILSSLIEKLINEINLLKLSGTFGITTQASCVGTCTCGLELFTVAGYKNRL